MTTKLVQSVKLHRLSLHSTKSFRADSKCPGSIQTVVIIEDEVRDSTSRAADSTSVSIRMKVAASSRTKFVVTIAPCVPRATSHCNLLADGPWRSPGTLRATHALVS